MKNTEYDLVKENYAKKLESIRENVESAARKLLRTAATHMFVFMTSAETIPYALPIQCLPTAALKDYQCREMVIAAMVERNYEGYR